TVADEHMVAQSLHRLSGRPDPLGEPGAEEVVGHAPIGLSKIWERVRQCARARNGPVTGLQGESLVEFPADVPAHDHRGERVGCPGNKAELQPLVESEPTKGEHTAIDAEIIAFCHWADSAQMVGECLAIELGVDVPKLGSIIELQLEWKLGVVALF